MQVNNESLRRGICKCGKVAFTKKDAQTKKNQLESIGKERMRIYQCDRQDCWHMTKLDKYKK